MQSDILFDNIYIGHSVEDAAALAKESFKLKYPVEQALADAEKPKDLPKDPKSPSELNFLEDPVHYVKEKVDLFLTIAQKDPIQAVKFVPEVVAGFTTILVSVVAIVALLLGLGNAPAEVKKVAVDAKKKTEEVADKAAEAVTTGAEKAKGELNKRVTRSQQS
jgi:calnexin